MTRIGRRELLQAGALLSFSACTGERRPPVAGDGARKNDADFIVVGAGSAGAALAARLAMDTTASVLLLEAGTAFRSADVPAVIRSGVAPFTPEAQQAMRSYLWPDVKAQLTADAPLTPYPLGRVVGGGSSVNWMGAFRGIPEDFDRWKASGCEGWGSADVIPAFVRLEDDPDFGDRPQHGRGGPIPMLRELKPENWPASQRAFAEACAGLGHPFAEDHNAPRATGVSPTTTNTRDGQRISTNEGYLENARKRTNFTILGDALVEKVNFERNRAVSVSALVNGVPRTFYGGEIVLSAGAFNSPAILVRSGIGDPEVLRRLGVRTVASLRGIGKNLRDHPRLLLRYALRGGRPAARPTVARACVMLRYGSSPDTTNDLLIMPALVGVLGVALLDPVSAGELEFVSTAPTDAPVGRPRMLSVQHDVVRLLSAVRRAVEVLSQKAYKDIAGEPFNLGEKAFDAKMSDGDLSAIVASALTSYAHPIGTCRMGRAGDPENVVDPQCRVVGVDGLRVVDASIMPHAVRAHPNITSIMLGEHAATLVARRPATAVSDVKPR